MAAASLLRALLGGFARLLLFLVRRRAGGSFLGRRVLVLLFARFHVLCRAQLLGRTVLEEEHNGENEEDHGKYSQTAKKMKYIKIKFKM